MQVAERTAMFEYISLTRDTLTSHTRLRDKLELLAQCEGCSLLGIWSDGLHLQALRIHNKRLVESSAR
jgi:hypothetical protein